MIIECVRFFSSSGLILLLKGLGNPNKFAFVRTNAMLAGTVIDIVVYVLF